MIRSGEPVIDTDALGAHGAILGAGVCGTVPRDWSAMPARAMRAVDMPLIPESEWSARIKRMEADGSRLSDIRRRGGPNGGIIPSLDQNPWGYCWAHSSTHAVMMVRAVMNLPYVPLSAFAVAATIKGGRDEGGWGAQSLDFIASRGVPSQSFWPQKDADVRKDRPGCWENAVLHKVAESWVDAAAPQWDRDLSRQQVATLLLSGVPVVCDYNWWGHSVCALDLVETSPGQFGVRILNSWADDWGDKGEAVLKGSQAWPDGAVAPRAVRASEG